LRGKSLAEQRNQNSWKKWRATLRRHVRAVNTDDERGMYFWDYGNAFLKEAGDAGAEVFGKTSSEKGLSLPFLCGRHHGADVFRLRFRPVPLGVLLRVCRIQRIWKKRTALPQVFWRKCCCRSARRNRGQMRDNLIWIKKQTANLPVVGSKSRILYADSEGRMRIARHSTTPLPSGELAGPVVLGRDHHDVSGTDSPYRETANIYDGSRFTADMAVHNVIGDAFRGATWVSLHNGGGVGWGEVINGGFGMVLDGSLWRNTKPLSK
jgi:urocanate hydratase